MSHPSDFDGSRIPNPPSRPLPTPPRTSLDENFDSLGGTRVCPIEAPLSSNPTHRPKLPEQVRKELESLALILQLPDKSTLEAMATLRQSKSHRSRSNTLPQSAAPLPPSSRERSHTIPENLKSKLLSLTRFRPKGPSNRRRKSRTPGIVETLPIPKAVLSLKESKGPRFSLSHSSQPGMVHQRQRSHTTPPSFLSRLKHLTTSRPKPSLVRRRQSRVRGGSVAALVIPPIALVSPPPEQGRSSESLHHGIGGRIETSTGASSPNCSPARCTNRKKCLEVTGADSAATDSEFESECSEADDGVLKPCPHPDILSNFSDVHELLAPSHQYMLNTNHDKRSASQFNSELKSLSQILESLSVETRHQSSPSRRRRFSRSVSPCRGHRIAPSSDWTVSDIVPAETAARGVRRMSRKESILPDLVPSSSSYRKHRTPPLLSDVKDMATAAAAAANMYGEKGSESGNSASSFASANLSSRSASTRSSRGRNTLVRLSSGRRPLSDPVGVGESESIGNKSLKSSSSRTKRTISPSVESEQLPSSIRSSIFQHFRNSSSVELANRASNSLNVIFDDSLDEDEGRDVFSNKIISRRGTAFSSRSSRSSQTAASTWRSWDQVLEGIEREDLIEALSWTHLGTEPADEGLLCELVALTIAHACTSVSSTRSRGDSMVDKLKKFTSAVLSPEISRKSIDLSTLLDSVDEIDCETDGPSDHTFEIHAKEEVILLGQALSIPDAKLRLILKRVKWSGYSSAAFSFELIRQLSLIESHPFFTPEGFVSTQDYYEWKNNEIGEIKAQIARMTSGNKNPEFDGPVSEECLGPCHSNRFGKLTVVIKGFRGSSSPVIPRDGYVVIELDGHQRKCTRILGSDSLAEDIYFFYCFPNSAKVSVTLYEKSKLGEDRRLGSTVLTVEEVKDDSDMKEMWLPLSSEQLLTVAEICLEVNFIRCSKPLDHYKLYKLLFDRLLSVDGNKEISVSFPDQCAAGIIGDGESSSESEYSSSDDSADKSFQCPIEAVEFQTILFSDTSIRILERYADHFRVDKVYRYTLMLEVLCALMEQKKCYLFEASRTIWSLFEVTKEMHPQQITLRQKLYTTLKTIHGHLLGLFSRYKTNFLASARDKDRQACCYLIHAVDGLCHLETLDWVQSLFKTRVKRWAVRNIASFRPDMIAKAAAEIPPDSPLDEGQVQSFVSKMQSKLDPQCGVGGVSDPSRISGLPVDLRVGEVMCQSTFADCFAYGQANFPDSGTLINSVFELTVQQDFFRMVARLTVDADGLKSDETVGEELELRTHSLSIEELLLLTQDLLIDWEHDRNFVLPSFPVAFRHGLCHTITQTYYDAIIVEVERFVGDQSGSFPANDVFLLYDNLQKLHQYFTLHDPDFMPVKIATLFSPMVKQWLALTSRRMREWTDQAVKLDVDRGWKAVSSSSMHAPSVVDVFCAISQVYYKIKDMEDSSDPQNSCVVGFLEQICPAIADIISRFTEKAFPFLRLTTSGILAHTNASDGSILISNILSDSKSQGCISVEMCVQANTIEALRENLDKLCIELQDYATNSNPSAEVSSAFQFQGTFRNLKLKLKNFAASMAGVINGFIYKMLHELIHSKEEKENKTLREATIKATRWARAKVANNKPTRHVMLPSAASGDFNAELLEPLLQYLEDQLVVLSHNLYYPIFQMVLRSLWEMVIQDFDQIILPDTTPRRLLDTYQLKLAQWVLIALRSMFYGDGEMGIPAYILDRDSDRVKKILKLYRIPTARFEILLKDKTSERDDAKKLFNNPGLMEETDPSDKEAALSRQLNLLLRILRCRRKDREALALLSIYDTSSEATPKKRKESIFKSIRKESLMRRKHSKVSRRRDSLSGLDLAECEPDPKSPGGGSELPHRRAERRKSSRFRLPRLSTRVLPLEPPLEEVS